MTKRKSFWSYLSLYFLIFCQRHYLAKMPLKKHWKTSTCLGFRWLTKSVETIKLDKRSFCGSYSLCFCISMIIVKYLTTIIWIMIIWLQWWYIIKWSYIFLMIRNTLKIYKSSCKFGSLGFCNKPMIISVNQKYFVDING